MVLVRIHRLAPGEEIKDETETQNVPSSLLFFMKVLVAVLSLCPSKRRAVAGAPCNTESVGDLLRGQALAFLGGDFPISVQSVLLRRPFIHIPSPRMSVTAFFLLLFLLARESFIQ